MAVSAARPARHPLATRKPVMSSETDDRQCLPPPSYPFAALADANERTVYLMGQLNPDDVQALQPILLTLAGDEQERAVFLDLSDLDHLSDQTVRALRHLQTTMANQQIELVYRSDQDADWLAGPPAL